MVEVELVVEFIFMEAVGVVVDVDMKNSFELGLDDMTHLVDKDGKNGRVCADDNTAVAAVSIMAVDVTAVEVAELIGAVGGVGSSLPIIGPSGTELTPVVLEVVIAAAAAAAEEEEEEKE